MLAWCSVRELLPKRTSLTAVVLVAGSLAMLPSTSTVVRREASRKFSRRRAERIECGQRWSLSDDQTGVSIGHGQCGRTL